MSRLVLVAALCAPIAGLAVTLDQPDSDVPVVTEIRVSADELQECRATLKELEQRPVVTDGGTLVPDFLANEELPRTVCVLDV